ncbi:hypothetical protein DEJ50_26900 [Streptomyces venezuelae]|uniref:Secreted protein n=1 Tax=Streptomyces venezuelae TaxID=54571 RepID=A0A5P2D6W6_STRVZ|nr:hypothetical protein [Streptomyces venezuelae]QES50922.1 hypothetical protein DEJ50_26900 [Streptomyces venezuelae]
MHNPAEPALPHTHARPLHWLTTAAAMAAVIAAAGLLQPTPAAGARTPGPQTAAAPGPQGPGAQAPGPQTPAPDPKTAAYPLDCRGGPHQITGTAQGDLDRDGHPDTVVAVRCEAGLGTPPNALYVLAPDPADTTRARVVATLLPAEQRRHVTELAVRDGAVTATLLGYSGPEVPRCCPDTRELAKWVWTAGKFSQELTTAEARSA